MVITSIIKIVINITMQMITILKRVIINLFFINFFIIIV